MDERVYLCMHPSFVQWQHVRTEPISYPKVCLVRCCFLPSDLPKEFFFFFLLLLLFLFSLHSLLIPFFFHFFHSIPPPLTTTPTTASSPSLCF
jgi:hypothetical protein